MSTPLYPPHSRHLSGWMQTFTGMKVTPLRPFECCSQYTVADIAWALSMKPRFGGHCSRFYSVGQHCLLVSKIAERLHVVPKKLEEGDKDAGPAEVALAALLHDASEAYLPDFISPIKSLFCGHVAGWRSEEVVTSVRNVEMVLLNAILTGIEAPQVFDLVQHYSVEMADQVALKLECDELMGGEIAGTWNFSDHARKWAEKIGRLELLDAMAQVDVYNQFCGRFIELRTWLNDERTWLNDERRTTRRQEDKDLENDHAGN